MAKARRWLRRRMARLFRRVPQSRGSAGSPSTTAVLGRASGRSPTLVIVIDGLRPDSINASDTPNLFRLRRGGVDLLNGHAVFPTGTRVNAATIATGAHPDRHGILNNSVYIPNAGASGRRATPRHDELLRIQGRLGGRLLLVETLAEILARHGMTFAAASSGSTSSTLLLDPKAPEGLGALVNGSFDAGVRVAYPDDVNRAVIDLFGPAPVKAGRSRSRDALVDWTQHVLMEYVVPELAPDVVIDWFTEPDHTQHAYGAGSPEACEALRNVDRNIGYILSRLEQLDLVSRTNILVTSDHGVTRYERAIDLDRLLIDASLKSGAESDDVLVVANGPAAQLFVKGHDEDRVRAIVSYFQAQQWSGVVFTPAVRPGGDESKAVKDDRPGDGVEPYGWVEGTFSLEIVRLFERERHCDVLLTFPWSSANNEFGVPGTDVTTSVGKPMLHSGHGGMSPWAMRTATIFSGPDFKDGASITAPVSHVDLAPTILHLKGIDLPDRPDGRVIVEALKGGPDVGMVSVQTRTFETAGANGSYRAALQVSEVEGRRYVDKSWRLPAEPRR